MSRALVAGRTLAVLALGIPLFGWIDLTSTWRLGGDTTAWDLAYGCLTGLLLPAAFVAGAPLSAVAGALAYAIAGVAGGQLRYVVLGAAVAVAAVALLGVPRERVRPRPFLVLLAVAATPAFVVFAVHATRLERAHLTSEAHAGLHAWAGVAAFAIAVVLVAWSVALGGAPRLVAWSLAAGVAYFGLGSVVYPDAWASVGRVWGTLAIVWGVLLAVEAARDG